MVRSAVHGVNPNLSIFNVKTMARVVADSMWELNLYRWLIVLFAGLAVVLAAIGLYGVVSYNVTSRTREFSVRLALGSDPLRLTRLVVGRAVRLTGAGLAGGALAGVAMTRVVQNVSGAVNTGPAVYAAISTLLLVIALAACVVPAVRVARVNPATALRHD
jgi:ABC-type antimicrobial peptide transport system permease subunit